MIMDKHKLKRIKKEILEQFTVKGPHGEETPYGEPVAMFRVGSHNYGVADENSDIDYKVITLPDIEQLVKNKKLATSKETPDYDFTSHSAQDFFKHMAKGNLNFVEFLFLPYKESIHFPQDLDKIAKKHLIKVLDGFKTTYSSRYGLERLAISSFCTAMNKQKAFLAHIRKDDWPVERLAKELAHGWRLAWMAEYFQDLASKHASFCPDLTNFPKDKFFEIKNSKDLAFLLHKSGQLIDFIDKVDKISPHGKWPTHYDDVEHQKDNKQWFKVLIDNDVRSGVNWVIETIEDSYFVDPYDY